VSLLALGVDVGGTSTRIATVDGGGTVIRMGVSPTPRGATAVVDHVASVVDLALADLVGQTVELVGVGMPGRIDVVHGTVSSALNLGIEEPVPVRTLLETRVGVPVIVENDVNAAALGAFDALALDERASLAFVSIGTGLATGHVVDGRLHRGATGAAGELGHVPVPGATVRCPCGQTGCLEAIASGGGMLRRWTAAPGAGVASGGDRDGDGSSAPRPGGGPALGVAALWDAADAGEVRAVTIRDDAVGAIAWTVQLLVMLLDVDVVVLGGGVSRLGDRLRDPVAAALGDRERGSSLIASAAPSSRLRLAPAASELGAVGAVLAARRHVATPAVTGAVAPGADPVAP
jgi:glucokinase